MAGSWSDPSGSNATSAALSSPFKFDAASIGQALNAILNYREHQQQQQQQSFDNMLSGISKGVQGGINQYNQGQADDAANAALYGHFYPNDAASAYSNPDVVPDYGGTNSLRAMQQADAINRWQTPTATPNTYTDANGITYIQGPHGWSVAGSRGGDSGGNSVLDQRRAQIIADAARKQSLDAASGQIAGIVGYDDLPSVMSAMNTYKAGTTPFPLMQGNSTPDTAKDQLISAVEQYRRALQGNNSLPQGINQSDVNQANEAMTAAPPSTSNVKSPSGVNMPKQGDVIRGYKFLGGDPADKNNWEKQ